MIALVEDAEPSARDIAKLIQQIKIGSCPSDLCRHRFGCRKTTGHLLNLLFDKSASVGSGRVRTSHLWLDYLVTSTN